jgi:hypothetical protein
LLQSGLRIIAEAQKSGLVLMVAENAQFWHEVCVADSLLKGGSMGGVLQCRVKCWESM